MADQTPPEQVDTSGVGGPDSGAAAEQVDWQARALAAEDRYGNLQPEYTRTSQEAAQLREAIQWHELMLTSEDPDIRRQAAEALGYEFEEDEQPAEDTEDPLQPYDKRLSALEERDNQREAQQQELENVRATRAILDTQLEELMPGAAEDPGVKFDQDQVLAYAINALPVDEETGLPPIALAHQLITEREDARQQAWARSKRAPMFSPSGQTTTQVPNLDNDQERQDYMTNLIQANQEP